MAILKPGLELAGYQVLAFAGRGGMGEIYRARQVSIDREVALKVLSPKLAARDPRFAEQFTAEARAAGRLNHPNIIAVHDVGQTEIDGTTIHYFSMEFVDGENLKVLVDRDGPLDQELIARVMVAMADALSYAARMKMIHRDIKPENLMLTSDGLPKLADFGLATQADVGDSAESAAMMASNGEGKKKKVMGTPRYMSPEQARGRPLDHRSDQYSLGATLFHLLTGQPPYRLPDARELMKAHVRAPVPDPFDIRPIPEAWRRLCMRLMAKDPDDRYTDPEALCQAVAEAARGHMRTSNLRIPRHHPGSSNSRPRRSGNESSKVGGILLLGAGIVAAIGVVLALSAGNDPGDTPSDGADPLTPDQHPPTDPANPAGLNGAQVQPNSDDLSAETIAAARAFISSLPNNPNAALRQLNGDQGLQSQRFRSAPDALKLLQDERDRIRDGITSQRDQARQTALQRLGEITKLVDAGDLVAANQAIAAMPMPMQRQVSRELGELNRRINQLISGLNQRVRDDLAAAATADEARAALSNAVADGLPDEQANRLRGLVDRRVNELATQAAQAAEAEAEAAAAAWSEACAELQALRGSRSEPPDLTQFRRQAGRLARRFDADQAETMNQLALVPPLAQAVTDALDRLLAEAPPRSQLTVNGRSMAITITALDGDEAWVETVDEATRMRRPLTSLSMTVEALVVAATRHVDLDNSALHIGAYLWLHRDPAASKWLSRSARDVRVVAMNTLDSATGGAPAVPTATSEPDAPTPSDHLNVADVGDDALAAFTGAGFSIEGKALRWTQAAPVEFSGQTTDADLPTSVWRRAIAPGSSVTLDCRVNVGSRVLVGLRRNNHYVRLGFDNHSQKRVAGIVTAGQRMTLQPRTYAFAAVDRPMQVTASLSASGELTFTINGERFTDGQRQPMSYQLPGSGPAELVLQSLDRDGQATFDIFQISVTTP